jgi:transposase-like protein
MTERRANDIKCTRLNRTFSFPKDQIITIVGEVESGALTPKDACIKYGMAYGTITVWMGKYGSAAYHANKRRMFSQQHKRSVVRAVLEGRITKKEACIANQIGKNVLNVWILKHKRESQDLTANIAEPMPKATDELYEAQLKIRALETLIDIAEEEFKISIRKKSGAKQ